MHPSLCTLIDVFFAPHHLELSKYTEDAESKAYEGCSFIVGQKTVIYRKAKQTPKKVGQFVTFWKREGTAPIAPFHIDDLFDYYIIYASNETETGVFVFTKDRLRDKAIVSTARFSSLPSLGCTYEQASPCHTEVASTAFLQAR
jgi:hypothetical protein